MTAPEPFYRDDLITLYQADCRDTSAWLAADVLVTDPPYGVAYESNMNLDRRNVKMGRPVVGDNDTGARDRILDMWADRHGTDGPALVFGRWDVPRPAGTHTRLIWDKGGSPGMGNLQIPWGPGEEEIYVLGRGFAGRRTSNVIRVPMLTAADRRRPDHPTPKPVGLMEALIAKCPPGVIADPFAGSGTTLLAAKLAGRPAIGVELEERYCAMIVDRLSQDSLFVI